MICVHFVICILKHLLILSAIANSQLIFGPEILFILANTGYKINFSKENIMFGFQGSNN